MAPHGVVAVITASTPPVGEVIVNDGSIAWGVVHVMNLGLGQMLIGDSMAKIEGTILKSIVNNKNLEIK
ncbi:hypothetical protein Tco_0693624 [Tanacetum coccineum]